MITGANPASKIPRKILVTSILGKLNPAAWKAKLSYIYNYKTERVSLTISVDVMPHPMAAHATYVFGGKSLEPTVAGNWNRICKIG